MDSGRLEALSDGVFAVAITLLALDLAVVQPGHGPLAGQLTGHWPSFAAYVVSFLTIGIIWVNHHGLFKNIAHVDRTLLFLNLLLLFFVVSIPFATSTIADYLRDAGDDAKLAAAIYEGVFLCMGLSFALLFWWSIKREHLKEPLPPGAVWSAIVRFGIGNLGYLAAVGVAFLSPAVALLISALLAVYYMFEQTPARRSAASQTDGTHAGQDTGSGQDF
jgi:uncharacterized membrane protein